MLNRIDSPVSRSSTATAPPPSTPQAVREIIPAQSALDMINTARSDSPFDLHDAPLATAEVSGDSFAETLEDLGFAVGTGSRDGRRGIGNGRTERARTRAMLQQLIKQIGATSAAKLDNLRQRIPAIEELDAPDDAMRDSGFDAGEMALLLGALLEDGTLIGTRRSRVEDALSNVLDSDEWALQLFNYLEFGQLGRTGLTQLRQLYQRAGARQRSLTQWFDDFHLLSDRQRKLKTLIRALAFELSAQGPAMDRHLAAVIADLKRILQFLGIEDFCTRSAHGLNIHGVDGDSLIRELLEIIEQTWISSDWLTQRTQYAVSEDALRYRYAKTIMELFKLLPNDCFSDDEQRDNILDACREHLESLADSGL
ncbi:type III secretion system gatekeeper subunit SctW [Burkholderia ubonensis]|uniref:type III secretion system gatekeeper subunit SctW n=1 Tax=Burkholderia ubonensis TaxID=101571 RepID=UPI00075BD46D|nr:type III secretion system gatekeeper subunit SctW [Burkholderia ubonensis]KWN63602.1 secretion protein [Burkholderia ubonensis]